MDEFTEVSSQGWFSRIGDSLKGIVVGLILFVIGFPVLWLNEKSSVKTYKTLKEGSGQVITVSAEKVDAANEGKLIHLTGRAVTEDKLNDPKFGVSVNAIKLSRNAEMYQWQEDVDTKKEKKVGGKEVTTKTYSYNKTWSSSVINSSGFKKPDGHENPGSMKYKSKSWAAKKVDIGPFTLTQSLIGKIGGGGQLDLGNELTLPEDAQMSGGGIYIGGNPSSPEVGDIRITFREVPQGDVSLVAKQVGNSFQPFTIESTGKSIELLDTGSHSSEEMFASAQASNKIKTWILRAVGFALQFFGLCLIFKPLSVLGDVIPLIGSIIGAATGLVAFLFAFVTSMITIAIAWIVYRPVLGVTLLVLAVGGIFGLKRLKKPKAVPAQ